LSWDKEGKKKPKVGKDCVREKTTRIMIDRKIGRIRENTTSLNTDRAKAQNLTFWASFGTQK
jgi:hypothetical protein